MKNRCFAKALRSFVFFRIVLIAAALSLPAISLAAMPSRETPSPETPAAASTLDVMRAFQDASRAAADRILPSVVLVNFIRGGAETPDALQGAYSGSGVMVRRQNDDVYVLTNRHIVEGGSSFAVELIDGQSFPAELVGSEEGVDLAVLVFSTRQDVPLATLADSSTLRLGDWVMAAGNPLGFNFSVSAGIVCGLNRRLASNLGGSESEDFIQTDVHAQHGSSGGPLVNMAGEVVGIMSWFAATQEGESRGYSFAVPSNTARRVMDAYATAGRSAARTVSGWFGASVVSCDSGTLAALGRDLGTNGRGGALIVGVYQGSPTLRAGLRPGDVVIAWNGAQVLGSESFTRLVRATVVGQSVRVDYFRNGAVSSTEVAIEARPSDRVVNDLSRLWPGMTLLPIPSEARNQLSIPETVTGAIVLVVEENSPAARSGLQPSDVVIRLGGEVVRGVADFYRALNAADGADAEVTVWRQGAEIKIRLPLMNSVPDTETGLGEDS